MDDLKRRLGELDETPMPDLWPSIWQRARSMAAPPASPTRLAVTSGRTRATVASPTLMGVVAVTTIAVIAVGVLLAGKIDPNPVTQPGADSSTFTPGALVDWDSGSVRLQAESLAITAGDKTFHGAAPYSVRSDPGDEAYRTLEVGWTEDGVEQRLYMYFAADEQDWWVTEIRTRDGYGDADWLTYDEFDLLLATPRGEAFEGDLHLTGGRSDRDGRIVSGELAITGLSLTAFSPGTGPGPLVDCENVRASVRSVAEPLDEGQPLAATGIEDMSSAGAEALLREMGICFTFRYFYRTSEDDPAQGYSERWCTAPPTGKIGNLIYSDDGEVVVFVRDDRVLPLRDQPPEGWNCPSN